MIELYSLSGHSEDSHSLSVIRAVDKIHIDHLRVSAREISENAALRGYYRESLSVSLERLSDHLGRHIASEQLPFKHLGHIREFVLKLVKFFLVRVAVVLLQLLLQVFYLPLEIIPGIFVFPDLIPEAIVELFLILLHDLHEIFQSRGLSLGGVCYYKRVEVHGFDVTGFSFDGIFLHVCYGEHSQREDRSHTRVHLVESGDLPAESAYSLGQSVHGEGRQGTGGAVQRHKFIEVLPVSRPVHVPAAICGFFKSHPAIGLCTVFFIPLVAHKTAASEYPVHPGDIFPGPECKDPAESEIRLGMRVLLLVVAAVPEIRVRPVYPHDYLVVTETPSFGGADIFLSSHILFKNDTELPVPYAYIAGKGSAHISRTGQESVRSSRDIGLEPGLLVFDVVFFFVVIKVLREKQDVYPFSGGTCFGIGVHDADYILRRLA